MNHAKQAEGKWIARYARHENDVPAYDSFLNSKEMKRLYKELGLK